jgi:TPR repeat protein
LTPAICDELDGKPVMGNADLDVKAGDLPALREEALQGRPDAAHRLALYYNFIRLDLEESYFWTTVAAENGDARSQNTLGDMLIDESFAPLRGKFYKEYSTEESRRIRAIYWFKKAAENGDNYAKRELERLGVQ